MKIQTHKDLPLNKELYLGPKHQQFCNRYLRHTNNIEVQHIYRYGKNSKTMVMSNNEFDNWLLKARKQS